MFSLTISTHQTPQFIPQTAAADHKTNVRLTHTQRERWREREEWLATLDVIVECQVAVAVFLQQTKCVGVGKVLKLYQRALTISTQHTPGHWPTYWPTDLHAHVYTKSTVSNSVLAGKCELNNGSDGASDSALMLTLCAL